MLNEPIIIQLNQELCESIQYLYYMTESYKAILEDLISNKRCINANKELLNYYNNEYINHSIEFRTLQEETINTVYEVPENKKAVYYIDFIRQCIVITDLVDIINKERS